MNNRELRMSYLLEERYRPPDLEHLILPKRYVPMVEGIINSGKTPHLLLYGPSGCGKTSLAYILAQYTEASLLYINASLNRTTDVMKNQVLRYCTKNAIASKKYKVILLDEIDNPYAKDFRKNLLSPMERYGENTRFILTANNKTVLDKSLVSRCCEIDFIFDQNETKEAKKKFIKSLVEMMEIENIKYDIKAIAMLVEKKFPDMRKIINTIGFVAKSGNVGAESVDKFLYYDIDTFFSVVKSKDFTALKNYVQAMNISADDFYKGVYEAIPVHVSTEDIPKALIKTYEYMRDNSLILDPYISMNSFGLDIMNNINLK